MSEDAIPLEEAYDAYPRIEVSFRELLDGSLDPRGPESLYELVGNLNLPNGATAVDVGCGDGEHAVELAGRFGFDVLGVDPVARHIEHAASRAASSSVRFAQGIAEHVPVADCSVDLIWCREVLMYAHLDRACDDFHRVLRPGGYGLVYQVCTGPRMSDAEAIDFWRSLGASSVRAQDIEEASERAGLLVADRIEFSSEWEEKAEEDNRAGTRRLLHAARLLRDPDRYVDAFGRTAYQIMVGDCLWHVYRMIGKLTGCAYILHKPQRA